MKKRNMMRYLMELGCQTLRTGHRHFRLNLTYLSYEIEAYDRPEGFNFQDIVEHFCWLSGCSYYFDDTVKPDRWLCVRLPKGIL